MKRHWLHPLTATAAAAAALVATGCSGSTPAQSGGGDGSGRGPFTLVIGKDTTGKLQSQVLDVWNKAHPDEKVKVIELPESADEQRAAMVQNAQARSDRFDVLSLDVVWTSEFAARGWVDKLPEGTLPEKDLLASALDTATYKGDLYAAPYASDAGLLYYRKDLVSKPPTTWKELIADCKVARREKMGCYAGQFAQYEGLTVNASEAINSAGGSVVGEDGTVTVDSPEAKAGIDFLVDGFRKGYIPKKAITYKEEDGRRAFQQGDLLFLRNWPYMYNLANTKGADSTVAGRFGVAPLPGADGVGASTLGGHNLAISAFSKHKKTAREFLAFMSTTEVQQTLVEDLSFAPARSALYDDPALGKKFPYLPALRDSLAKAEPRPKVASYNEVSLAIQKEVYAALQGDKGSGRALKDLDGKLRRAAANR